MEIIIHRINKIINLKKIPRKFGTEIDIRSKGSDLILNHDPFCDGEKLIDYLDEYRHGTLILNIKEAGIEDNVLSLVSQRNHIKSFFMLDVESPYLYTASRLGERNIAIRFSEVESIQTVINYVNYVDWVWIDTNTMFPIKEKHIEILNQFKSCLVCPERWGRPRDITKYKSIIENSRLEINCIMTSLKYVKHWSN